MERQANYALLLGGGLSLLVGMLHMAIIIGGADWVRFFGAGERLSTMAANGSFLPGILAAGMALILFLWAAYAFAGAGIISPLPLLKPALISIAAIYLARGLVLIPITLFQPERAEGLMLWSSLVCLVMGLSYAVGTRKIKKLQNKPIDALEDPRILARAKFCREICPIC